MRTKQAVIVLLLALPICLTGCGALGQWLLLDDNDATQQADMQSAAGHETTSTGEPTSVRRKTQRIVMSQDWTPSLVNIDEEENKGAGEVSSENDDTKPAKPTTPPTPKGESLLMGLATLLPPPWNVIVPTAIAGAFCYANKRKYTKKPTTPPAGGG